MKYRVNNIKLNTLTPNNRIYTDKDIEDSIINNAYVNELIKHRVLYVEFDNKHSSRNSIYIDPAYICAIVNKVWIEDDNYIYVDIDKVGTIFGKRDLTTIDIIFTGMVCTNCHVDKLKFCKFVGR